MPQPKKIVIIGPESTGKSTLTQALASHFGAPWVEEFAREYIEKLGRAYEYEDLLAIAQGQVEREDIQAAKAKDVLFCDTDLHVLKVWSCHKYGRLHDWTQQQLDSRTYDLYLLTDIDIPWEDDPQREHSEPEMRQFFMNWYQNLLQTTEVPVLLLSGNFEQRIDTAIRHIEDNLLDAPSDYPARNLE